MIIFNEPAGIFKLVGKSHKDQCCCCANDCFVPIGQSKLTYMILLKLPEARTTQYGFNS